MTYSSKERSNSFQARNAKWILRFDLTICIGYSKHITSLAVTVIIEILHGTWCTDIASIFVLPVTCTRFCVQIRCLDLRCQIGLPSTPKTTRMAYVYQEYCSKLRACSIGVISNTRLDLLFGISQITQVTLECFHDGARAH